MEAVHPGQTGVSYGKQAGRWEEMLGGAQLYFMNISGVEAGKLGVIGNFLVSVLSVLDGLEQSHLCVCIKKTDKKCAQYVSVYLSCS